MPSTYLLTGGGTGGHLTPGLAVASELRRRDPTCRVVFVGTDRPLERRLIENAQYEHRSLPVESSRTLVRHPVRFFWKNWQAWRKARQILAELQPAGVIGLGGFASAPLVWVASRQHLPTLLLEQNAIPGRTTRLLCQRVQAVCTSFPTAAREWPAGVRIEETGNPVRHEIVLLSNATHQEQISQPPTLLILGGSQGAESLNAAVAAVLTAPFPELADWKIVHQTGSAQQSQIAERYTAAGVTAVVAPFFDDMPARYADATLVISRAGATTLAELACARLPAILLPYPHATDNHQLANARHFAQAGAALIVEHESDPSATPRQLKSALLTLMTDPTRRQALTQATRSLARPAAAAAVVDLLESLIP